MKTAELASRLTTAANTLEDCGFACLSDRTAEEMARSFATSTFPLRLFLAWLRRTPEARDEIDETLLTVVDRGTGPIAGTGGSVKTAGEPPVEVGKWQVSFDVKAEPLPVRHEDFAKTHDDATAAGVKVAAAYTGTEPPKEPAQKSEPTLPAAEPADVSPSGVRGVAASSLVVSLGEAAKLLGKDAIRTRPVAPKDSEPRSLGLAEGFRGQAVVNDPEGKPLRAVAKFANGEKVVEFLDKRGPLILARIVGGEDAGTVVTICIEFIEPRDRGWVLATLDTLSGATGAFNFSPFDGSSDPWDKSQTISHPTTVEEPGFGG